MSDNSVAKDSTPAAAAAATANSGYRVALVPGALEVSAGVDPEGLPEALAAILAEVDRLRIEDVPADELGKAKRYLAGGLELRMEETRHVASWIGGQEALHDRVLTVDEALAAIDAITSDDVRRVANDLVVDSGLRLAVVAPARYLRGLDRHQHRPFELLVGAAHAIAQDAEQAHQSLTRPVQHRQKVAPLEDEETTAAKRHGVRTARLGLKPVTQSKSTYLNASVPWSQR